MNATENGDRQPDPSPSRQSIEAERRGRFILIAAELAKAGGHDAVTATRICQEAATSRSDFYDLFASAADCLGQGADQALELLLAPIGEAGGEGDWLPETAEAIAGYLAVVASRPLLSELLLVHSALIEPGRPHRWMDPCLDAFSALFHRGRRAGAALGLPDPPPMTDELLAHGVVAQAKRGLSLGRTATLPRESGEMAFLVGVAYLGAEETTRILGAPSSPGGAIGWGR